jgi:glycerophosphoryl diester phosphodiesterase
MRRPFLEARSPIAFAHRGGCTLFPENTLRAFQGAIDLGCRYIETDVHLTRDREIVVFHDHRLERTTNGSGFVRDHKLSELRRLDAGFRYTKDGKEFPFRDKGIQIPTFTEAITLDPGVHYNVELKERGRGLPQAFWKLVERHAIHDRILVAAFDDSLVREFRRLSRGTVATSAGQREAVAFWLAARARATRLLPIHYDALQVPPTQSKLTIVDDRFVHAAHARGLAVHVWTIDEAREMRRLLDLGVDGIMSDRPDTLLETLAKH